MVKAARKKVLKAMVERAPEVEKQTKVIIEALSVLKTLQREVNLKDKESHATYINGGWLCEEFSSQFIPSGTRVRFDSMLQNVDKIRLNARKLIADDQKK